MEEHITNYQAASVLMGKGRNAGGGAAGLIKVGALRESLTLKCGLAYVTTLLITSP